MQEETGGVRHSTLWMRKERIEMDKMTKKILIVFVVLVAAAVLIFAGVRI